MIGVCLWNQAKRLILEFKKQTEPLLPSDLRVTWEVLAQLPQPSMAFYNCGELSGAR